MKRLAFCFYGQVRFIEGLNLFFKHFKEVNKDFEVDFFISTWRDFDISKINLIFNKSEYLDYESTTKGWRQGNTRKMSYLMQRTVKLKQNYELKNNIKYDTVVILRPDIIFDIERFTDIANKFNSIEHDKPTVLTTEGIEIDEGKYIIREDWIYLLTSEAANIHAGMHDFFFVDMAYRNYRTPYREGGHWIHSYFFLHNNFKTIVGKFPNVLIRPLRDLEVIKKEYNKSTLIKSVIRNLNKIQNGSDRTIKDRVI